MFSLLIFASLPDIDLNKELSIFQMFIFELKKTKKNMLVYACCEKEIDILGLRHLIFKQRLGKVVKNR